jgi:hypothetical protein
VIVQEFSGQKNCLYLAPEQQAYKMMLTFRLTVGQANAMLM